MPYFYYVIAKLSDGSFESFDGFVDDLPRLERELEAREDVVSWTVDYES